MSSRSFSIFHGHCAYLSKQLLLVGTPGADRSRNTSLILYCLAVSVLIQGMLPLYMDRGLTTCRICRCMTACSRQSADPASQSAGRANGNRSVKSTYRLLSFELWPVPRYQVWSVGGADSLSHH